MSEQRIDAVMNVYFVSIGDRPFAKYVVASWHKYLDGDVVQITDEATKPILGIDRVIRYPYDGHMMLFMITNFALIEDEVFITTGDDCIINDSLDHATGGEFDVAICKRHKLRNVWERERPYTNGIVVVKHPFFYKECLHNLLQLTEEDWDWGGDMLCIGNVLEGGKYLVKQLPQDKYCRKPRRLGDGDSSAVLWHYSGQVRKDWMPYHGRGKNMGTCQSLSDSQAATGC